MTKSAKIKRLSAAVAAMALGAVFAVTAGGCAHKHTFSNEWQTDQTHHWHAATCTHSGEVSGKAVHDFGETDVCGVCRYDRSTGTTPPNPTDPTPPKGRAISLRAGTSTMPFSASIPPSPKI